MSRHLAGWALCLCVVGMTWAQRKGPTNDHYYGLYIGHFENRFHNVQGQVYAVDSRTLFIKDFHYDGSGPDAFFYAGEVSDAPSDDGFQIADEQGTNNVLGTYSAKNIVLNLPQGKSLRNVKWLSVWCRSFSVNFGEVTFSSRLDLPRPQKISSFNGIHDVKSSRVVVVDAQTFLIPKFSYDGSAPDAHFWVGTGTAPGSKGSYVADENGSTEPLKAYNDKTLVIVLPGDITVFDIDWLSVWCVAFFVDFGHILLPKDLNVPPSLRMLGIEPQSKLNCEVLDPAKGLEVRWAIAGRSIVTQLVAKLDENEYMAFGLSGDARKSAMVGGDVTVAWMDHTSGKGFAEDYHLGARSQCAGGQGACPDSKVSGGKDNVRLLNSAVINEFTMLTYRRSLLSQDPLDTSILTNASQPVIWAIGPINSKGEVSFHSSKTTADVSLDFGRVPKWNCPISGAKHAQQTQVASRTPKPAPKSSSAWFVPPILCHEPEDGVFFAQIGATGGEQGYSSITGHVGWGIAWYINGLLIPEIHVVRGKSYTFVVEGGQNPDQPSGYHPFYITDDPEGGYQFKSAAERKKVKVFAGVKVSRLGGPEPTALGRLCEWKEDPNENADRFKSFGAYQRSLTLDCQEGQPGIMQWTPDANTPDLVYYQCYTHRYLGWKIHVVDQCN